MQLGTQTIWPSQKGYIQTEPVAAAVIWINFTVKKPPSKENCVGLFCQVFKWRFWIPDKIESLKLFGLLNRNRLMWAKHTVRLEGRVA